jgi:hypothetical protein
VRLGDWLAVMLDEWRGAEGRTGVLTACFWTQSSFPFAAGLIYY